MSVDLPTLKITARTSAQTEWGEFDNWLEVLGDAVLEISVLDELGATVAEILVQANEADIRAIAEAAGWTIVSLTRMATLPGGVTTERAAVPTLLAYLVAGGMAGVGARRTHGWVRAAFLVATVVLVGAVVWTAAVFGLLSVVARAFGGRDSSAHDGPA